MNFNYPSTLPVVDHRKEILDALQQNQVIVVAGDTGSGKTTQIPKMCLELAQNSSKKIGCTQPRRIAAITVAERVAEELEEDGGVVGYKIRFKDATGPETKIKFMTDGVLLAETRKGKLLKEYDILMIDEAHERSLNIDFLLGHIKNILPRRPDLKVVITSATIDTLAFSKHFDDAPIISIPGKTYPVEVRYEAPEEDDYGEQESALECCVKSVKKITESEPPGDILVFLPTERDIRVCCDQLKGVARDAVVLPLFGRLHGADQKKIFQPSKKRKIVVATNVAETSITVPGIRYVIDSGLARMAFYNHRAKTNSLPVKKISQASCDQRKGRCGRVGPGVCIRLYDEDDYLQRDQYTIPEIKRSNLAEVILQMRMYKLGDPVSFPFLDPPHPTAIKEGYRHLLELGAINKNKGLTSTGKMMAAMPIDPSISRIVIEANRNNCLREVVAIAAVLAIQDPRVRPSDYEQQADTAHERFLHPFSDFLGFLNVWNEFHAVKAKTSWSRMKKFCKTHFLSFQRMREWVDLHDQMMNILKERSQFGFNTEEPSYEAIHKSLAIGFLRNIATKKSGSLYTGPHGKELMIFPGSSQFQKKPGWIVAASFLETSRLYALHVASIEPEWLEPISKQLCSYSWSNPRFQKKTGRVVADEQVSLFGLIIVSSRVINFGKTNQRNREEARNIFIRSALVEGRLVGKYPFLKHNLELIESWEDMEDRLRAKDIIVDEEVIFSFYDRVLPSFVHDRSTLNSFLKKNNPSRLYLQEEDVVQRKPYDKELADFPPTLRVGSHEFSLSYLFDPSHPEDGVSIRIPLELAQTLSGEVFEWLVPGLLQEKTTTLLKGLPKRLRRQLVPINKTVDMILDDIELYKGSYYRALEASIFKQFNLAIRKSDWPDEIPSHLQMRFVLYDLSGKEVVSGRDWSTLDKHLSQKPVATKKNISQSEQAIMDKWEQLEAKEWCFDGLPAKIPIHTATGEIGGYFYPVVTPLPEKALVTIRFTSTLKEAREGNRQGMRYLIRLLYPQQYKSLKKNYNTTLSGPSSLWLIELFNTRAEAVDSLLDFTIDALFATHTGEIPSRKAFEQQLKKIPKPDFYQRGKAVCDTVMALLRLRREVLSEIKRHQEMAKRQRFFQAERYDEYHSLLEEILPADFIKKHTFAELEDCERYLNGLMVRMERAHSDFSKDQKKAEPLQPHISNLLSLQQRKKELSETAQVKVKEYQKLIQEYRLSLFAPEIKTKTTVSAKKLRLAWQEVQSEC